MTPVPPLSAHAGWQETGTGSARLSTPPAEPSSP